MTAAVQKTFGLEAVDAELAGIPCLAVFIGRYSLPTHVVTPKKLISTVECPIQVNVTCASLHFEGSGLTEAGAVRRGVSMVHSRKR